MNNNLKQVLTSLGFTIVTLTLIILFAPLIIFLVIFLIISSFYLHRRILKGNSVFFKQSKVKKSRIIDQEQSDYFDDSNSS